MCIWPVKASERKCNYCTYVGCERHASKVKDKRADRYVKVMSDVVGANILMKSRKAHLVWARNMVSYQLRLDGYSLYTIGRLLDLDHATVLHCERQVKRMLERPSMYEREVKIWEEFQNQLKTIKR